MTTEKPQPKQRQRAPSKRSLATRGRILDAAELLFAEKGFDGASMRDIATAAGVQVGLAHHHGGSKEALFHMVVERRAEALAALRLNALDQATQAGTPGLEQVMACFLSPYLDCAECGGPGWRAYARLVAMVSSDERWRDISESCFDPAAARFINEIARLYPSASPEKVSTAFVFCVASMLALCTSEWRIEALGAGTDQNRQDMLLQFCCGGIRNMLEP